jgi:hypothetical protein
VLWIGTWTGLNGHDTAAETFQRYFSIRQDPSRPSNNIVEAISIHRGLWIDNGGLNRFDQPDSPLSTTPNSSTWHMK